MIAKRLEAEDRLEDWKKEFEPEKEKFARWLENYLESQKTASKAE